MNFKLWTGLFSAVALVLTSACSEDKYAPGTDTGAISLSLDIDHGILTANPSRASLSQICEDLAAEDFTIRLTDREGKQHEWAYSSFDGKKIKTGDYTIEAYSGRNGDEGFDKAYFHCSAPVTVATEATTPIALTAALANSAVKVVYSEAFRKYMSDYSASVRTAGATEGIAYGDGVTDELFINPGDASLYVSFTTPQGKSATLKAAEFTAEPRHLYTVTIDVNGGEISDAVLSVTFDDKTVSEDVEITLSDELLNMPAPMVSPETLTVEMIEKDAVDAKFEVIARTKFSALTLTTDSDPLIEKGWPAEINLAKASDSEIAKLTSLGLKLRMSDMMAIVDLGAVVSLIEVNGVATSTVFRLEAEDSYGKVSDPYGLMTFNIEPLSVEILSQGQFYINETQVELTVEYNGSDFKKDVEFEAYYDDRAVWDKATIESVTKNARSRSMETYTALVNVPGGVADVKVRAKVGTTVSPEFVIRRVMPEFTLSNNDLDNFARHADILMECSETDAAKLAPGATYTVSRSDGTSVSGVKASFNGNRITLSGLPDKTTMTVTAKLGDKESSVTLTTEEDVQLPYAGMEEWDIVPGKSKYWWESYLGESSENTPWGTMNLVTTSAGGSGTTMFNHTGCAYVARSGTDRTTECHGGTYAAVVKSIGWGKSDANGGMNAPNRTAGSLHLGNSPTSESEGINYGMNFTSRPDGLSFWYKYVPYNPNDYGYVEVWVKDAEGTLIAVAKNENVTAQGEYAEMNLKLDYTVAAKAASICVIFKSTNNPDCLTKSSSNFTVPPFGNLDTACYEGSMFYIDDIKLIY